MIALTASYEQMTSTQRAYFELHIAVFLWGFTAILGDLIQLSALSLVWWRVFITSISVGIILWGRWSDRLIPVHDEVESSGITPARSLSQLSRKSILQFAFVGALTGLHWLTFFGAIKLSNASITLVCMATCALFTAIFEPLILRSKFNWFEIGLGVLIIPGMALVVDSVDVSMHAGIWVGLISALLASVFSIYNKKWIGKAEPMPITFIEMASACLVLTLVFPFFLHAEPDAKLIPSMYDLGLLLVLALACTTFTWVLALRALKHLSAFASTLTVNLEPVYGILLAFVLLGEHKELSTNFYWGVLLILAVVFSYPFLSKKMQPEG